MNSFCYPAEILGFLVNQLRAQESLLCNWNGRKGPSCSPEPLQNFLSLFRSPQQKMNKESLPEFLSFWKFSKSPQVSRDGWSNMKRSSEGDWPVEANTETSRKPGDPGFGCFIPAGTEERRLPPSSSPWRRYTARRISREGPWKSRKQKGSQMVWDDTMPGAYRLSSLCFWAPCVGVEPCLLGREPCAIGSLIS